eukprot:381536-Amorphochlora_amoeboformis.AAC.1
MPPGRRAGPNHWSWKPLCALRPPGSGRTHLGEPALSRFGRLCETCWAVPGEGEGDEETRNGRVCPCSEESDRNVTEM